MKWIVEIDSLIGSNVSALCRLMKWVKQCQISVVKMLCSDRNDILKCL